MVAHEWLTRVFEPIVMAIPWDLRAKLEPAEVFHQVLEHRWYMSQARGRSVPLAEVVASYIDDVLRHRRDEATGHDLRSREDAVDLLDDLEQAAAEATTAPPDTTGGQTQQQGQTQGGNGQKDQQGGDGGREDRKKQRSGGGG